MERVIAHSIGSLCIVAVAFLAVVTVVRAQEDEARYWRTNTGPTVLSAEQEVEKASKPGSDFTECANGCPTMIVVPAGRFTMGSPATEADRSASEGPQHAGWETARGGAAIVPSSMWVGATPCSTWNGSPG
jgi:hypothetical protein